MLDYACGTGILTLEAARRCAPGRVVGVDLSDRMLQRARLKASAAGLRVEVVRADAEQWEPPLSAFDVVMAAYLPKYVDLEEWLPRAARALRSGGRLLAYDFTYPRSALARAGWEAWWRVLGPRLARRPGWEAVAEELPALVRRTHWADAMQDALPLHGFTDVRVQRWAFGACTFVEARLAGQPARPLVPDLSPARALRPLLEPEPKPART